METATPILFDLNLSQARDILYNNKGTRQHLGLLDSRLDIFRKLLREELDGLIEDCVELAFYRCSPESITRAQVITENETCDECGEYPCECEGDESHAFDNKDHCDTCSEYWWEHHTLAECLQEDEESNCSLHNEHTGSECHWTGDCELHCDHDADECNGQCESHKDHDADQCNWNCPDHKDHVLASCDNQCNQSHTDVQWHQYLKDGDFQKELVWRHNTLYPQCGFVVEQKLELPY